MKKKEEVERKEMKNWFFSKTQLSKKKILVNPLGLS